MNGDIGLGKGGLFDLFFLFLDFLKDRLLLLFKFIIIGFLGLFCGLFSFLRYGDGVWILFFLLFR